MLFTMLFLGPSSNGMEEYRLKMFRKEDISSSMRDIP